MVNRRFATCLVSNIGTIKFIFHICNLLCAFACIQLIVFGVANIMDIEELDVTPSGENINSPHTVSIILGVLMLLNSCYGFSSAAKQIPSSMNCYALIQLNIFVFCVITLWVSEIEESMTGAFQYVWDNHMINTSIETTLTRIQLKLGCCGMNGPNDYYDNNSTHLLFSCCSLIDSPCTSHVVVEASCRIAVDDWASTIYIRFLSSLAPTAVLSSATFILMFYYSSAIALKPYIEREQHIDYIL